MFFLWLVHITSKGGKWLIVFEWLCYLYAITVHWIMIVIVIICNQSMYISSCLALSCLELTWLVLLLLLYAWRCMSSFHIIVSYEIISYLMFFNLISSVDLFSILFYFFHLIWFNLIRFDWFRFTILFSILPHINEWFVSIYLSVCLSVWIRFCSLFSFFSLFFFLCLFFLMNVFLTRTCTCMHTDTHIHMNISFSWLVLITSKVGKWRIVFGWLYYFIFDLIR